MRQRLRVLRQDPKVLHPGVLPRRAKGATAAPSHGFESSSPEAASEAKEAAARLSRLRVVLWEIPLVHDVPPAREASSGADFDVRLVRGDDPSS